MAFHESAVFPDLGNGSSGGPGHNTLFLEAKGGGLTRYARWAGARRQFDAKTTVTTPEDAAEILRFYIAREGGTHGFRFKDWNDYTSTSYGFLTNDPLFAPVTALDQLIGTGDGTTTQFQLVKRYTDGAQTRVRPIYKPVDGTVKVAVAGTEIVEGTDFTVDTTTGTITLAVAPTLGQQVTAGFEFDCAASFGPGADALLNITIETFYQRGCPNIPIIEDIDPSPWNDEYPYLGAFELAFSIPTQITPLMGRVASLTPGAATDLLLPSAALYEYGGIYMILTNLSGSHTITVKSLGVTIGTIAAGATKFLVCAKSSGAKAWRLV